MIFTSSKFGHDISTWQDAPEIAGSVNFETMKNNGAAFVILRSSVGDLGDADFETYKINSRGHLPRGLYHYWWNSKSPQLQAQVCINAIGGEQFEGRVWLDLENSTVGAYANWQSWKTFLELMRATGLRVGIYTGYYWWQTNAVNKGADLAYFRQFPLWQAWYTDKPADVQICTGWDSMMIWQDTALYNGQNAGVESTAIDRDKWNDAYNFETEWGATIPLPGGNTMLYGRVNTGVLNVRTGAGAAYTDIGDLQLNDHIIATETVGGWLKLKEAYRGGWNGEPVQLASGAVINTSTMAMWCKDSYIVIVDAPVVVTPPPPPPPVVTLESITIEPTAGTIITYLYSDGTTKKETV